MTNTEILCIYNDWRQDKTNGRVPEDYGITPRMITEALDAVVRDAGRYEHLLENSVSSYGYELVPTLVCRFSLQAEGWREEIGRRIDADKVRSEL
ncbi:hypothetical protein [Leptolyngbya phage Lbo-JY16]